MNFMIAVRHKEQKIDVEKIRGKKTFFEKGSVQIGSRIELSAYQKSLIGIELNVCE